MVLPRFHQTRNRPQEDVEPLLVLVNPVVQDENGAVRRGLVGYENNRSVGGEGVEIFIECGRVGASRAGDANFILCVASTGEIEVHCTPALLHCELSTAVIV